MSNKKYQKPQISIIMFEPQAILAGSGPISGSINPQTDITAGSEEDWE